MALNADNKPIFHTLPDHGSGGATSSTNAGAWNSDTDGITVFTAPTNGASITSLTASTDDAADKDLYIYILDGSEVINLGRVTVPDGSGTNGTDGHFDILANIEGTKTDQAGDTYLPLKASAVLKYALQATLTASDFMEVGCTAMVADS